MSRRDLLLVVVTTALVAGVMLVFSKQDACAASSSTLLELIRNARGDGIPAIPAMNAEAEARADEIVSDFSHDGADHAFAEILAWNTYPEDLTEAAAVQQWLDSPDHRRILLGDWSAIGVGVADSGGSHYYAALFGQRPKPTAVGIKPESGAVPKELPATDTVPCA